MRHYTPTTDEVGKRLDQYLTLRQPDLTRQFIQKLIEEGHVFVNSKKIKKSAHRIKANDEITVLMPSIKEIGIRAENIPLDIVYEDENMLVISKPAGMVTHPTDRGGHVSGTVVNAVLHHCRASLSGISGEKRPGIVHRLDKDTSGLLMVAKNDRAHHDLAKQIEARQVKKIYLTLLKGKLTPQEGSIEAPILKTQGGHTIKVSGAKAAKYALTHYKVLETIGDTSLVQVHIITGRTHQIRVHFASIGHPVAGDTTYGNPAFNELLREKTGLTRQFLHAATLTFKIPEQQKSLTVEAPLANDLKKVLQKLKKIT